MAVYCTGCPGWSPCGSGASEYAGVVQVSPHYMIPCLYNMGVQKPSPQDNRKFLLNRSVFDLVDGHKFLSLTDPKLLNWYLCLTSEDRRIIRQDYGGYQQFLLRHPALELSQNHVYVKRFISSSVPARPTMTSNRPTSTSSGAAKCRSEMSGAHLNSERRPNNMRETLNPLGYSNSGDGPQKHPTAFSSSTTQAPNQPKASSHLNEQRPLWPMSSSGAAVWKDSSALTSFSLDVDLEQHRQGGQPEFRSQTTMTQWLNADCTYAEVSLLQSDCPTIEKDLSSEYYSFDSIQMDDIEYSSVLDPVEENRTEEGLQDHRVSGNEHTEGEDEAGLSFGDQSFSFQSNMECDKAVLFCLTSKDVKAFKNGAHSGAVHTDGGLTVGGQCFTKSAENGSSPMPCVTTRDIMVGTDVALCISAVTQTEGPETADKNVITEVHMADLDYLAEEFTKLTMVQEELREQKEEMKRSGCKLRKECDCVQRAQRAELSLLALQYIMCRQYCWKLHCTYSEGGQPTPSPENPSSNIASVLQKLESDYNRMRDEIRAGVPLEQLKPLSVDPEKIATRPRYIPAKILSDMLGNVPSCSQDPQNFKTSGEENNCPNDQSSNGSQHSQNKENEKRIQKEIGRARRAVPLVLQEGDATHNAHKPEEKRTAACQELNASEAWYDAEEDLHYRAGPAVLAETGQQQSTGVVKDETNESASEEVKSSVLCVSNLPSNVTESDVMLWFEKHHPSEVSISALKNDLRVAIVTVSGPQSAEAALRELHGRCTQGRTLHVEHINRAGGGSQRRASASVSGPESPKDSTQPQTSKTERELMTRPLGSSVKNRKVVYISPTAKGTCVPQHYGTMGSFDTLMAELTQRHPAVGRQRIVDALMELRAEHGGVLSGLPLRTIREMTSELLSSRPATAPKL